MSSCGGRKLVGALPNHIQQISFAMTAKDIHGAPEGAVAVYEWWHGRSGRQVSSLYTTSVDGQERVDEFIREHHESGTHANLETFTDEKRAARAYARDRRA